MKIFYVNLDIKFFHDEKKEKPASVEELNALELLRANHEIIRCLQEEISQNIILLEMKYSHLK